MQAGVRFTIFDADSGEQLRLGMAPRDIVAVQATGRNEIVFEGHFGPDVRLVNGLPRRIRVLPVAVAEEAIDREVYHRLRRTDWAVTRQAETGKPIPDDIAAERQRIRDRGKALKALSPIPHDFTDSKHWE